MVLVNLYVAELVFLCAKQGPSGGVDPQSY